MVNIIVIPVLNEEKNIVEVIKKTKKNIDKNDKIIVVDNNSIDNTVSFVKKNFQEVEIIFEKNKGKGNALRRGFQKALGYKSDFITMIDGDGEKDPADISKLVEKIKTSDADMVIGFRSKMRSKRRTVLEKFENWWLRTVTGYDVRDGSCGFNIFRSDSLAKLELKTKNFEIEPEILLECRRNKMKVIEHPVNVPMLSPTKVQRKHIIEINRFFDKWVLNWIKDDSCDLSPIKKMFLKISCKTGLIILR
ncbi:MAG: glycosyltransferase family 2 protein [Candidatus Aenigmarchaeota archaeon]|nr:glycosyltransferase family 2 protein [Candidatus Aenigmarchaeota archaeon]